jgi:hypothetical protein
MTAATVVLLVVLGATVAAAASIMVSTRRTGTPPMPVSPVVLPVLTEAVRRALPATERPVIVEAGCGWGTVLFTLHDAFPHADVRGIERSPVPWLYSRLRASLRRDPGTVIVSRGDLFRHSFREADLLVAYLSRHHMERLSAIEERLPPVVVSVAFALPGRRPDTTLHAPDIYHTSVYVYRL